MFMQRFFIEWWWVLPLALAVLGFRLLPKSGRAGEGILSNICWSLAAGILIGHFLC